MDYSGPGKTGELTGELLDKWRTTLSAMLEGGIRTALQEAQGHHADAFFFNPLANLPAEFATQDIDWIAFPRPLSQAFPDPRERWRESDKTREVQEEYCEWTVVRDAANQNVIRKIIFTTETPDYFSFLFAHDQRLLLDIYRRHVSPEVELQHLVRGGDYSVFNKWNHPGSNGMGGTIMHMGGNQANTLGAAITLAAEASWPSIDGNGNLITGEQALIHCRQFGKASRHSDPHIGAQVNQLVRLGKKVSMAGPVGLYIHDIDFSEFEIPEGLGPRDIFKVERGTAEYMMRIAFEAPQGAGFNISDVKISGQKIAFGGQIADKLRIRLRGLAIDAGSKAPAIPCDDAFKPLLPMVASRRSVSSGEVFA